MRHAYPQTQVIAVAEGIVIAGAGPDVAELGGEPGFLGMKSSGVVSFMFQDHLESSLRQSRPFGERRIVGEIAAAIARRTAMGIENHIEAKRLRRLRNSQPCTFGVASTSPVPLTCLIVSVTGSRDRRAGAAGSWIAHEITVGVRKGRAASSIRTMSASPPSAPRDRHAPKPDVSRRHWWAAGGAVPRRPH